MDYFLVLVLIGVAMWGQYWYDKAHRVSDAMMYMLEQEEAEEDADVR